MKLLRAETGTSVTEVALMLPVLTALIFWSNYLWDVGRKKIKVLEAAQYAAWETAAYQGGFGKGPGAIRTETMNRFADMDGTTASGAPTDGKIDFNEMQMQVRISLADSVKDANVDNAGGLVSGAVGSAVKPIFRSLVGSGRLRTQVTSEVTFSVRNRLLPPQMAGTFLKDPLEFKTKSTLIYDSWAAWRPGDQPTRSLDIAKTRIVRALKDSNGIIAFPLIGAIVGDGTFVGSAMSAVLGVLGLPNALEIKNEYVQLKPRSLGNDITREKGVSSTSAGMPGKLYEGVYWTGNGWGPPENTSRTRRYSYLLKDSDRYYRADINRHVRMENCRGHYYYGSIVPEATYYKYRINNTNACTEYSSGNRSYTFSESGTRRGLKLSGTFGLQIEED